MASKASVLESVHEDDFVEYFLFPAIDSRDDKEQEIVLNRILSRAEKIVEKYTKEYLWHKDEFKLNVRTWVSNSLIHEDENTELIPPHLYGVTHFGDNIEDEWFIVFLLRQLTKEIDGLIARIYDADGEFLLIEAAEYLPGWADPATCEKRVYIFQGNIHIIPLTDSENPSLSLSSALSLILNNPTETLASCDIQNSIINKLQGYPEKIASNLHHVAAYLPVGVAAILTHRPALIAPAVQVFCNRDSVDAKTIRAMKYFPPENRVNVRVTFTKCLYAMLAHSKYVPDRRTGWNLPKKDTPQFKSHDLGVKIACGFEILATEARPSEDVEGDKGWVKYMGRLKEKNYFRGLLEGSREYNDLLNKSKDYYVKNRDSMRYTPPVGQEVLELSRSLDYRVEELKKRGESLPPDDDDSWLNITAEELDKMLEEKYGQKKFVAINNNSTATTLTEKLSNFLNHVSDLDGVEHPDPDDSPTRPPRGVKKRSKVSFAQDTKTETNTANNRISFDPNAFSCAVQNILNFVIPEDDSWDLDSGSDMSDYADETVDEASYEGVKNKMQQYMEEMDKELAKTTIGESFERKNGDSFEDIESFKPVDIDMNALKNILESYRAQMGEAGPSSNMLGPMGVHLETE